MKHTLLYSLTALLAPAAAARVYTGFNYGAFWGEQGNAKRYADFHHSFELAKNLTTTPVPFDSARLFTCITAGTKNDPTEAFEAAIDTNTNLLLGMWVSPGATGQPNDELIENELAALGKGFEKHGQKLADLVIGLSVGNEDIYRFMTQQAGVGSDNMLLTMNRVKSAIKDAPWANYMADKPIGHTDTATYAVLSGSDFIGMTAYPYWEGKSIDNANVSFMSTLKDTQRRAGNTPVWISEAGWPINGTTITDAVASADNYQRYWNEVGCQVFGNYNTFWFELLQDSTLDQPDWGLLDTKTYQPRIKDLSCGRRQNSTAGADMTLSKPGSTALSTAHPSVSVSASASTSLLANSVSSRTLTRIAHTTSTRTITVYPTPDEAATEVPVFVTTATYISAAPAANTIIPSNDNSSVDAIPACIIMMDVLGDGVFIPVATYAVNMSTCTPPPRFTGSPFTMVDGPGPATESWDLYAPTTTDSQSNGPTCVTAAGTMHEAVIFDGKTYTGNPTASCPAEPPTAPTPPPVSTQPAPSAPLSTTPPSVILSTPTSPPPSTLLTLTTPSPSPAPTPTPLPLCAENATLCLPISSTSWSAIMTSGVPSVLPGPVTCSDTNTCTFSALPSPGSPPTTAAADSDIVSLATGKKGRLQDGVSHVLVPEQRCSESGALSGRAIEAVASTVSPEGNTTAVSTVSPVGDTTAVSPVSPFVNATAVSTTTPMANPTAVSTMSPFENTTAVSSVSPVGNATSQRYINPFIAISIFNEARASMSTTTWASPIPPATASPVAVVEVRRMKGSAAAVRVDEDVDGDVERGRKRDGKGGWGLGWWRV